MALGKKMVKVKGKGGKTPPSEAMGKMSALAQFSKKVKGKKK